MLGVTLLLVGLAVVAAASAVEVAVFALPDQRLKELDAGGGHSAACLKKLRHNAERSMILLWLGRIVGTGSAVLGAWLAASWSLPVSLWFTVAAVALCVALLVAAELAARTLTFRATEAISLAAAVPVWALSRILLPVLWPAELVGRLLGSRVADALPRITDREIRGLASPGNGEPQIDEHERRLIQRAFLLDQTCAYDVMTPRVDIFAWPESLTLAEIAPELRTVRYSRVPLYGDSIDSVTGILYARDAHQALISGQRDVPLQALAREPFFVPGSLTLDRLLLDFQSRRIHMGIVIDEYGGTDGLITLEDILEELVGEIVDESDVAEDRIVRLGRNDILVHGGVDLREINHFFNTTFPLLEHRSLNGYLLAELGRVPAEGEKILREEVLIEVLEATDTQVVRARLSRQPPRAEAGADESGQPPRPPIAREADPHDRRSADRSAARATREPGTEQPGRSAPSLKSRR